MGNLYDLDRSALAEDARDLLAERSENAFDRPRGALLQ
jgi:hypothetical protein